MASQVETHYTRSRSLIKHIADALNPSANAGQLHTLDLAPVDEFHIRGRKATLELAARMQIDKNSKVLDIGSGLGGPARTLAEIYGCHVIGIDLTAGFCEAATQLSKWTGLDDRVTFLRGDASDLPFADKSFDAVMTIHAAMNIAPKDVVYRHARRVVKPGGIFAVYDVLQGEGGAVLFPVPWARDPSISHLATPDQMRRLLLEAGFEILDEIDSTEQGLAWFGEITSRRAAAGPRPLTPQLMLGADFPQMTQNLGRNLADRRIRTVSYICRA
jgi:ubiquinone/menaquinone biosynthesis C-methylase UbiE